MDWLAVCRPAWASVLTFSCTLSLVGCVGAIEDASGGAESPAEPTGETLADAAARDAGNPRPGDASQDAAGPANDAHGGDAATQHNDASAAAPGKGYYVANGLLYDGCGEQVVLRGINHPTLYVDRSGAAMPEIAKTGANVVRLFWYASSGVQITEAEAAIEAAVANGMVPMLEMHDSTCAWALDPILDYWTSNEAVALIQKHEAHLLLNLANEPKPPDAATFKSGYTAAVQRMRSAGIHVPLVIDGGNCGRDYQMLLDNGAGVLAQDPDHNLLFSAHLYDPLTDSQYASLFSKANSEQLPFIVGEFANHQPPGCGASIDYKSLVAEAHAAQIGWLAWSWGDNDPNTVWNTDCGEFDMTSTFSYDTLQSWGKDVSVTLAASIQNTAVRPYSITHGDQCK